MDHLAEQTSQCRRALEREVSRWFIGILYISIFSSHGGGRLGEGDLEKRKMS